jgi:hypothetical protein
MVVLVLRNPIWRLRNPILPAAPPMQGQLRAGQGSRAIAVEQGPSRQLAFGRAIARAGKRAMAPRNRDAHQSHATVCEFLVRVL